MTCTTTLLPGERFKVGMLASMLWIRRQCLPLLRFLVRATCGSRASKSHIHQSPRDSLVAGVFTIFSTLFQFLLYKEWFSLYWWPLWLSNMLYCYFWLLHDPTSTDLAFWISTLLLMEAPENGQSTPKSWWHPLLLNALASAIIFQESGLLPASLQVLFLWYLYNGVEIHF